MSSHFRSLLLLPIFFLVLPHLQAQTLHPKSGVLKFFGQTLTKDKFILAHYYDEIPYSFLTVKSDDRTDNTRRKAILINLFFNTKVKIKKLKVVSSDETNMTHPVEQIHLFERSKFCKKEDHIRQNIIYFNKETDRLDVHVHPDPNVKDIKLKVAAYGLSKQSVFHITRHLLSTRNDAEQNELLLKRLYKEGYTTVLSLLKHEDYDRLYLPEHSLFYLPDDTDFSVPLPKILPLVQIEQYISDEGMRPIPKRVKKRNYLLFVDKEKVRFLKNINPQESIVIKKIDLAE